MRILAHRAQPQAKACMRQGPGGNGYENESDVGENGVREEYLYEYADPGHIGKGADSRNFNGKEPPFQRQPPRAPAFPEPVTAEYSSKSGLQHVDGNPRDHLVAALVDR